MFTNQHWSPYIIPQTPSVTSKSYGGNLKKADPYILSAKSGAQSGKNPSQYIEWSQIPINDIIERLDLIEEKIEELDEKIEELDEKAVELDGRITSVEESINTINNRLNSASINAVCNDGTVTVTLNL